MDKQLHLVTPTSGFTECINTNHLYEHTSSSVLFQPKNIVQFETAWDWQAKWQCSLLENPNFPQAVWLLEHQSCYTFGRASNKENLLFDDKKAPFETFCIDRGGDVTHHVEGQLVVYLVMDLSRYQKDLHWYLRELETVVIETLSMFDLPGERMPGLTGVWCNGFKVASIGVGCKRWITQHGFALNVNCALDGFDQIKPCGLEREVMGKMDQWIDDITVDDVKKAVITSLGKRFKFLWINNI